MTDKIKITGPNRLVLMDLILGAFAKEGLNVDVECDQEWLSCDEITRRIPLISKLIEIEVVE